MNKPVENKYVQLRRYLEYTLHELPAGVIYGTDGASEKECAELLLATYQLEELAAECGADISEFLATCRWHYERYPHYLGRQRHFGSYANYMAQHHAPTSRAWPRAAADRRGAHRPCLNSALALAPAAELGGVRR